MCLEFLSGAERRGVLSVMSPHHNTIPFCRPFPFICRGHWHFVRHQFCDPFSDSYLWKLPSLFKPDVKNRWIKKRPLVYSLSYRRIKWLLVIFPLRLPSLDRSLNYNPVPYLDFVRDPRYQILYSGSEPIHIPYCCVPITMVHFFWNWKAVCVLPHKLCVWNWT